MQSQELIKYYLNKRKVLALFSIVGGFSSAIFNGVSIVLIIPLLVAFISDDNSLFKGAPAVLQKVIGLFDGFTGDSKIFVMFVVVFLALILKHLMNFVTNFINAYLTISLNKDMKIDGAKLLLKVDIDYYNKNKMGDIFNRYMSETNRVVSTITSYLNLIQTSITILLFVGLLLSISWPLTIFSAILASILAFLNQSFVKRAKKYGEIVSLVAKQFTNKLLEILTGIRLIKASGNENYELEALMKDIRAREKAGLDSQMNSSIISPMNEIGGVIIVALIIILGRYLFADQLKSVAAVVLTYLYILFRLLPLISQINGTRSQISNNSSAVDLVADFLSHKNKPIMSDGDINFTGIKDRIEFKNVKFSYPQHEELVLKGVNFSIPRGKMIALVGASGAGKSTIADLLPRFYDPTAGEIVIDGKNIKEYTLRSLRRGMGIVSQDTFLFNNSVRYNIAYGLTDVTEEQIILASKSANAYEFIINLPEGFDTELGDRGVRLSGGQKQRISIARALLRNPDILILDEATSALDTISEKMVQEALDELTRTRTTIVIAHRLSTIQKADKIIVLDKGVVVETGTHDQLLNRGGHYSRLHAIQFGARDNDSSDGQLKEQQAYLSYKMRSQLNGLLGSLRLLADGLVEDEVEENQLLDESFDSAMGLLQAIELLEERKPISVTEKITIF
ncbi:MAG: Heterocyst differentiation ATP-binding protein HepA [Chroococcopsis gigantea SAG 12.99]|jgi:subfamily B ATP-binding cassette protein MsbA|nr:ABC transporter ATP-binding protein [Chlorogloea purpurea SAG 13.99]MDV3001617.1 Heterocyst differentiation ATP-binding protein HepA [Chroococcopsis gigantea SAG 12.99]